MQSDILGVYAMGIKNMLCLSGDHQRFGNHPQAKNVFDLDSMQLIALAKKMRDEGKFLNGEELDVPPKLFIGAASNPFADPIEFRVHRLAKKIASGADFVQTQCIYNMDIFRDFMKKAVDMGLHEKCYILAGVTPMKSVGMAQYMAKSVPGMDVPESLIKRLREAGKGKVAEEGIKFALEQIEEFKEMEGVAGVHLMAIEWEHKVPEIAERAGVLPRPKV
jgi:methylenetetrahydrofolate reductase (NADPH)